MSDEGEKPYYGLVDEPKTKGGKIGCKTRDRYGDPCRNYCYENSAFCKLHQYMIKYTDEQLQHMELCSGCLKVRFMNGNKTCDEECRGRQQKYRKELRDNAILCKGFVVIKRVEHPCKYKRNEKSKYMDYCDKHQMQGWKDEMEKDGCWKVCYGYFRGCRNLLDVNDAHSSCNECIYKAKYIDYSHGAKKRNLDFGLNKDDFYKLIENACYYCDSISDGKNGIDRIDNNIGYINGNIVSCCYVCNMMKGTKTIDNFLIYCKNIKNNYPCISPFDGHKLFTSYMEYKRKATVTRNIEFDITKNEFNDIIKNKCFYCGNTNNKQTIGLDRIDSNIGYNRYNLVACCSICNLMKNKFPLDMFYSKIVKINKNTKLYKRQYGKQININEEILIEDQ